MEASSHKGREMRNNEVTKFSEENSFLEIARLSLSPHKSI